MFPTDKSILAMFMPASSILVSEASELELAPRVAMILV